MVEVDSLEHPLTCLAPACTVEGHDVGQVHLGEERVGGSRCHGDVVVVVVVMAVIVIVIVVCMVMVVSLI